MTTLQSRVKALEQSAKPKGPPTIRVIWPDDPEANEPPPEGVERINLRWPEDDEADVIFRVVYDDDPLPEATDG